MFIVLLLLFFVFLNCKPPFVSQKAEYKAAAAVSGGGAGSNEADTANDYSEGKYGASKLIQSQDRHGDRIFTRVSELSQKSPNQSVWLRGRVHTSRAKGKQCFLILRQQSSTVQCVIAVNDAVSKQMVKFAGR